MSSFNPVNVNFQSPLNFEVRIGKLPDVTFNLQEAIIPGITLGTADFPTQLNKLPMPGDEVNYEPLELQFKVQEGMRDWMSIWTWIRDMGFPQSPLQFRNRIQGLNKDLDGNPTPQAPILGPKRYLENLYSEIKLFVLTSKENAYLEVTFRDAFPISISRLTLKTTEDNIQYLTASARFAYDSYDISKP